MINLKTGMVVEFCDGDMGIVINNCIYCHDSWLEINDKTLKDMFHEDSVRISSVNTIYMPSCKKPLDWLLDKEYYKEDDIIWKRNQILVGDIVIFTSAQSAKLKGVKQNTVYIHTGKGYIELPDIIIPYLNKSIRAVN
jgi:hypothetical protein